MTPEAPIETAAWQLAIGRLRSETLPQLATDALVAGVDTPSIRLLAGQGPDDVRDSRDLFVNVLEELGIEPPDKEIAHWRLVRQVARHIVAGTVKPAEGANVMRDAYDEVKESGDLRIFVGLLSELDSFPQGMADIEAQIALECKSLLSREAPRYWIKLMARLGSSPLTKTDGDSDAEVDANALPIQQELSAQIASWAGRFEESMAGWPTSGGFRSAADAEAFVAQGRTIVAELQSELGATYYVEYMPEPIQPPGLKLHRSRLRRVLSRRHG